MDKNRKESIKKYIMNNLVLILCDSDFDDYNKSYVFESSKKAMEAPSFLKYVDHHKEITFSESLVAIIAEKKVKEVDVYQSVLMDRKLFSKIANDKEYHPSKKTAIALGIGLKLKLDDFLDFIGKAGYTLSDCSEFDLIVRYFLENENYNIFEINEALDEFKQDTF